ncbi:MAG: hypothetical protein P8R54_03830 [Myxococcota bacterium]|nr:hypothetical protein [Myxococcota bacterium]
MALLQLTTITDLLLRMRTALTRARADRTLTRSACEQRRLLRNKLDAIEASRQELLAEIHTRSLDTLVRLPSHALRGVDTTAARSTQQPDPLRMCAQPTPTARALMSCDPETVRWMLSEEHPPLVRSDLRELTWSLQDVELALLHLASQLLRTHSRAQGLLDTLSHRLDRGSHIPAHLIASVLRCQHALHAPDERLPAAGTAARFTSPQPAPQAAPTDPGMLPAGTAPATPAARAPRWRAAGSADHFALLLATARS